MSWPLCSHVACTSTGDAPFFLCGWHWGVLRRLADRLESGQPTIDGVLSWSR